MKFWVFRFFVLSRPPQVPILLISIQISCTLFIWFVFNDLLQSIYFRRFCSKQLIIFVKTYLLSCRFHCIDIFYIKFRFCEAVIVVNFVTRILLIKNGLLSNQVARKLGWPGQNDKNEKIRDFKTKELLSIWNTE